MNYEVIFAPNALSTIDDLYEVIFKKWGVDFATDFLDRVWKIMDLLKENPFLFKASESKKEVRLGLVDRHTSFLYEIRGNKIIVLCFWNNSIKPFI
jgi:plasmid stabilization system protein ParE